MEHPKKKREVLTLEEKAEIIPTLMSGQKKCDVATVDGIADTAHSTISVEMLFLCFFQCMKKCVPIVKSTIINRCFVRHPWIVFDNGKNGFTPRCQEFTCARFRQNTK